MPKKIMTVEQAADREMWLKVRKSGIGGSDAAVIVGLNKWKSPYQLWLEKTGQAEPEDLSENEYVYWGSVLEEVVAKEFTTRTGKKVQRCGTLQDDEYSFILANVDRMIVGEPAGLECKTANGFAAKEWEDDNVPDAYYLQCQHYMMVTGCQRWYIAVLIGGNHFVWKTIERNESDVEALRAAEIDFWTNYVQGGEMPPVDGSDGCNRALAERFHGGSTAEAEFTKDNEADFDSLMAMTEQIKDLEARTEAIKNSLKLAMGDCEVGYIGERKLTWKTTAGRVSIDSKRLKAELPDVYKKYSRQGKSYRTFKIS